MTQINKVITFQSHFFHDQLNVSLKSFQTHKKWLVIIARATICQIGTLGIITIQKCEIYENYYIKYALFE